MLIKNGGITRNIDQSRLHEYKAKGYVPLALTPSPPMEPAEGEKKPKKPNAKD